MMARVTTTVGLVAVLLLAGTADGLARQARGGGPAAGARSAAPFDLTGYWVSLITDFWRYRMVTPPKGNVDFLPINAEGRRVAESWDPARDEAAGEQCRGYGAVGVMHQPGRLHITWEDDNTLRLDTDTGTQTRRLRFGNPPPPPGEPTWQGFSVAEWQLPGGRGLGPTPDEAPGQLKVVTTRLRPGYLRKNGVPYSGGATLTEYFFLIHDNDAVYLAVSTFLEDPQYYNLPHIRTVQFKKLPDATGWNPTPCSAR